MYQVMMLSACAEYSDIQLRSSEKVTLNALNSPKSSASIRFHMKGRIKTREMKVNWWAFCRWLQLDAQHSFPDHLSWKHSKLPYRSWDVYALHTACFKPAWAVYQLWTHLLDKTYLASYVLGNGCPKVYCLFSLAHFKKKCSKSKDHSTAFLPFSFNIGFSLRT